MSLALRRTLLWASKARGARTNATATSSCIRDEPFELPDGRTLGVREIGAQDGLPLLVFPNVADTRKAPDPLASTAKKHGIRLVTLERPGLGASTLLRGRSLLDWADDVRCFAEGRGIARFGILGVRTGGPHALACARALPSGMVTAVGLCSSATPWALTAPHLSVHPRAICEITRRFPAAYSSTLGALARLLGLVTSDRSEAADAALVAFARARLPQRGRQMSDAEMAGVGRELAEDILGQLNAVRSEGGIHELGLVLGHDWGFQLEDVDFGPVRMWHGTRDNRNPIAAARLMADRLPYATLREYSQAGSVMAFHRERILAEMSWMMRER